MSLGRVLRAHIRHSVLTPDGLTVDPASLRAISRLGGVKYARIGEGFELARPSWKEDGKLAREVLDIKGAAVKNESNKL